MQQEIFTMLKMELENKGYDVYDGHMPQEGTPYPFIYLGAVEENITQTKEELIGNVYQTVHVWHNDCEKRGTVSRIMRDIRKVYLKIENNCSRSALITNITERIMEDNTTGEPLMHGVSEVEFKFA